MLAMFLLFAIYCTFTGSYGWACFWLWLFLVSN